MDGRPTWTDCDEAEDYVVPNVLSLRDLVFRPDNMDETVPHTYSATGSSETSHCKFKQRRAMTERTWVRSFSNIYNKAFNTIIAIG